MARCAAIKSGGEPCKALPMYGSEWCWSHHPDNRQKHAANGARGGKLAGRGRARSGAAELRTLRARLADIADGVEAGEISPAVAHALAALGNVRIRAVEVERKVADAEAYEERIASLEAVVEERRHGSGRAGPW